LQVKLCDPRLSALSVPWCKKALYKYSSFPFLYRLTAACMRCVFGKTALALVATIIALLSQL